MSKPSLYAKLRFCPRCGLDRLERDFYRKELRGKDHKIEYMCTSCGLGFQIFASCRAALADELFALHRSLRSKNFHEDVLPQAREAFELHNPEPWRFRLWGFLRRVRFIQQDPMTHAKERERKLRAINGEMSPEFFRILDIAIRARGTPNNVREWAARLAQDVASNRGTL